MTCPNCGAEMERHVFTHVCSFCGHIIANNEVARPIEKAENTSHYYDYITKNLQYIKQSSFVDVIENANSFICMSSKPFYPNDGHYNLDTSLAFWWYAKISKYSISVRLLVRPKRIHSSNRICVKAKGDVFSIKQNGESSGKLAFPMTLDDFLLICQEPACNFDTNMSDNADQNNYQEFTTYTRRFYHLLIDRSKYRYSLSTKLLTD